MKSGSAPVVLNTLSIFVIWGSMYLAIGLVVDEAPPVLSMGLRYLTAGIFLGLFLTVKSGLGRMRLTRSELLASALFGIFMLGLSNAFIAGSQFVGLPSGLVALLVALVPLWVVLFRLLSGDRPSRPAMFGVLIGFVGMVILVLGGRAQLGDAIPWLGVAMVIGSGFVWALGSWVQSRVNKVPDIFVGSAYQMLFAGLAMIPAGLIFGERMPDHLSAVAWGAYAYLVFIGSIVGFTSFIWLINHGHVTLASTQAYVSPVIAVFLGWLLVGEVVSTLVLIGGGVVLLGVVVVVRADSASRRMAERSDLPD